MFATEMFETGASLNEVVQEISSCTLAKAIVKDIVIFTGMLPAVGDMPYLCHARQSVPMLASNGGGVGRISGASHRRIDMKMRSSVGAAD